MEKIDRDWLEKEIRICLENEKEARKRHKRAQYEQEKADKELAEATEVLKSWSAARKEFEWMLEKMTDKGLAEKAAGI